MQKLPVLKGFRVTSIKHFCKKNCILPRLSKEYLEEIISKPTDEVTLFCLFKYFVFSYVVGRRKD